MAQTIEQLQARLASIEAAIDAAITGKRYRISSGGSDRELERQSLRDLQSMKQLIEAQIARMESGGAIRHAIPYSR